MSCSRLIGTFDRRLAGVETEFHPFIGGFDGLLKHPVGAAVCGTFQFQCYIAYVVAVHFNFDGAAVGEYYRCGRTWVGKCSCPGLGICRFGKLQNRGAGIDTGSVWIGYSGAQLAVDAASEILERRRSSRIFKIQNRRAGHRHFHLNIVEVRYLIGSRAHAEIDEQGNRLVNVARSRLVRCFFRRNRHVEFEFFPAIHHGVGFCLHPVGAAVRRTFQFQCQVADVVEVNHNRHFRTGGHTYWCSRVRIGKSACPGLGAGRLAEFQHGCAGIGAGWIRVSDGRSQLTVDAAAEVLKGGGSCGRFEIQNGHLSPDSGCAEYDKDKK